MTRHEPFLGRVGVPPAALGVPPNASAVVQRGSCERRRSFVAVLRRMRSTTGGTPTLPAVIFLLLSLAAFADDHAAAPSFRLDVMPVLMKAGCNTGGCHG